MIFIRHLFTVVLLLASGFAGSAQKAEHVKVFGKLGFVGNEKRVLEVTYRKIAGGYQFDSCIVSGGNFKFEKEISEPIIAVLSLKPLVQAPRGQGTLDYISVLLLPGNVKILATENLRNATVYGTGAIANKDYQDYLRQLNLYIDTMNRVIPDIRNLSLGKAEQEKRMAEAGDSIKLIRDKRVYLDFFTSKIQSPVAVLALLDYSGEPVWTPRKKMVPGEIEKLLRQLPKKAQAYPSVKNLKIELEVSKVTGIGRPIIDFNLEDTSGRSVRLSDFKGKYVFLDFWASWCVPCRKENPNVKSQFEKYKDKGFTVVSVSLDKPDAKQAWLNAIQKDEISMFTHVSDLKGFDSKAAQDYYVKSIPTNFLISPDGKFLGRNLYGEALNKELAKIFDNKN